MRVLIIGNLAGQLSIATKMAFDKGAKVLHADDAAKALDLLRTGRGADIVMIDLHEDITGLVTAMKQERIVAPVVACGVNTDAGTAANAIRAGAREFIPLPPDPELIAAVYQRQLFGQPLQIVGPVERRVAAPGHYQPFAFKQ